MRRFQNDGGPVYVDQFGGGKKGGGAPVTPGPGQDDDGEAIWRAALGGRVLLWRMFWIYFLCGHGMLFGIGVGVMIFALLMGFSFDPGSLQSGLVGMIGGMALLGTAGALFALWSAIGLWRCAYNCEDARWGHAARAWVPVYLFIVFIPWVRLGFGGA